MLKECVLKTGRSQMIDITTQVAQAVHESGIVSGLCTVWCPHTTAAIRVNVLAG